MCNGADFSSEDLMQQIKLVASHIAKNAPSTFIYYKKNCNFFLQMGVFVCTWCDTRITGLCIKTDYYA